MYGLVNRGLEDLIRSTYGDATWSRICQTRGLDAESFSTMQAYPDGITYDLVGAASAELGVPAAEVLERFGAYWVLYTGRQGYGELFKLAGRSVEEVLGNLDALHGRVGHSFPAFQPPEFTCTRRPDGTLHLIYRSTREGLAPMVVGLIRGLGEHFQTPVAIEHTVVRGDGHPHDEFVLRVSTPQSPP
ncbi:MAG: heme NO-binding domain-containing protein [Proteobacteria bacterium]|nr:heme NO-binding domain-containing protein [Pseudomonadota bacterium]